MTWRAALVIMICCVLYAKICSGMGVAYEPLLDPLFDDAPRLRRHLVQRNGLDPGHTTPQPLPGLPG